MKSAHTVLALSAHAGLSIASFTRNETQTYLNFIDALKNIAKREGVEFSHSVVRGSDGELFVIGTKTPSPEMLKMARRIFRNERNRGQND